MNKTMLGLSLAITLLAPSDAKAMSFPEITLFKGGPEVDSERLWSQTKFMFGLGVGLAGGLYLLPESVTNWDKSELGKGGLGKKWWENVSKGPVWDDDHWLINYVGHPYFGGVYYLVARKSGYDQFNAFLYTALMSTFYWEYGIEAFAEVPSIQDLIVTPIGGWLYGEWAFNTEQEIRANDGLVFGSHTMGDIALFMLDPVDSLARGFNNWVGNDFIKTDVTLHLSNPGQLPTSVRMEDSYIGLQFHMKF